VSGDFIWLGIHTCCILHTPGVFCLSNLLVSPKARKSNKFSLSRGQWPSLACPDAIRLAAPDHSPSWSPCPPFVFYLHLYMTTNDNFGTRKLMMCCSEPSIFRLWCCSLGAYWLATDANPSFMLRRVQTLCGVCASRVADVACDRQE
jgi:hypothetical protein